MPHSGPRSTPASACILVSSSSRSNLFTGITQHAPSTVDAIVLGVGGCLTCCWHLRTGGTPEALIDVTVSPVSALASIQSIHNKFDRTVIVSTTISRARRHYNYLKTSRQSHVSTHHVKISREYVLGHCNCWFSPCCTFRFAGYGFNRL